MGLDRFSGGATAVLIIEDDDNTQELLSRMLEAMGTTTVAVAREGGEGLRIACETRPHVVICDIEMQPVDGLSFLAGLRASMDAKVAAIPVVMFTSHRNSEIAAKADRLGVTGYLRKPFNPAGFASYLVDVVERYRPKPPAK